MYNTPRNTPQIMYLRVIVVGVSGGGVTAQTIGWGKRRLEYFVGGMDRSRPPDVAASVATIAFSQKASGGRPLGTKKIGRILNTGGIGMDKGEIEAGGKLSP